MYMRLSCLASKGLPIEMRCVYALNPQCVMHIHRQVDSTGATASSALQEPWQFPGQVFGRHDPAVDCDGPNYFQPCNQGYYLIGMFH